MAGTSETIRFFGANGSSDNTLILLALAWWPMPGPDARRPVPVALAWQRVAVARSPSPGPRRPLAG